MLRVLFGFEGRIGRRNYLLAIICQMVILTGVILAFSSALLGMAAALGLNLDPKAVNAAQPELSGAGAAFAGGIGIFGIVMLIFVFGFSLYMSLAAQVKRLHDLNMSGWFTVLNFVPIPISATLLMSDPANAPIALFLNLIPLGLGLACLFFPGTRGPNEFGEDRLSIFDLAAKTDETWADRAQAHRDSLRDTQVEQNEAAAEAKEARPRKQRAPAGGQRKGFGKRGMA